MKVENIGREQTFEYTTSPTKAHARLLLLQTIQKPFAQEIAQISGGKSLPKSHRLSRLVPWVDENGLLRVGGRLRRGLLSSNLQCPILLPRDHCGSLAILRQFHADVNHQGRHLTLGALRGAGFHLEKGKQAIRALISNCVTCRLRGHLGTPIMADLPPDRLAMIPPFTNTSLDVFGPFFIQEGKKSRRRTDNKKIWVLLLTC